MNDQAEEVNEINEMRNELLSNYQSGLLSKLGIKASEATIKKASKKNIENMYNEYKIKYNTLVADDLVSNLLLGYTQTIKLMFPNLNTDKLHEKLNENVLINNEVKKQLGQYMNPTLLAVGTIAANTVESVVVKKEENETDVKQIEEEKN